MAREQPPRPQPPEPTVTDVVKAGARERAPDARGPRRRGRPQALGPRHEVARGQGPAAAPRRPGEGHRPRQVHLRHLAARHAVGQDGARHACPRRRSSKIDTSKAEAAARREGGLDDRVAHGALRRPGRRRGRRDLARDRGGRGPRSSSHLRRAAVRDRPPEGDGGGRADRLRGARPVPGSPKAAGQGQRRRARSCRGAAASAATSTRAWPKPPSPSRAPTRARAHPLRRSRRTA